MPDLTSLQVQVKEIGPAGAPSDPSAPVLGYNRTSRLCVVRKETKLDTDVGTTSLRV